MATKYVNNQTYPVNRDQEGMTVYTRDAYGNTNASYKLSTWTDPNNGKMGNSDVTITAVWEKTEIAVDTWKITYSWDGRHSDRRDPAQRSDRICEWRNIQD